MSVPNQVLFSLAGRVALVAVVDLRLDAAQAVAQEINGLASCGDVTSEIDLACIQRERETALGPVDLLVNNAGITGKAGKIWELERKDLDGVLTVNVTGPWLCCRQFLPGMLQRKFGRVVNVALIAGKEGNPTLGPYSASKAALIGLTKSIAKEVAGQGDITINAISPAVIATPILDGLPQTTVSTKKIGRLF